MLVACAALVVALGGVSYAATALPKNSVGTAQLRQRAVTGAKLKRNAVTSAKVKNGSLLAADFKAGQLPAGPQGPKGDTGPRGETGPKGDAGAPGEAATKLFAAIREDGSPAHGNGVTASTRQGPGDYTVTFNRPLDGCVATAGYYHEASGAWKASNAAHFSLGRRANPNQLVVYVYNSELKVGFDVPFSVMVFC
jgi:hypothetical protein